MRPVCIFLLFGVQSVFAQRSLNERMNEFSALLSLPNIASDSAGIRTNAHVVMDLMSRKGIGNVQELSLDGAPPALYGEVKVPGAEKTLVFYAHYDGQPVNPAQWAKGLEPFKPLLYTGAIDKGGKPMPFPSDGNYDPDWRIYGRSASDDKAGVMAILDAWEEINMEGKKPNYNIKFFFDGEEEAGSPHLAAILQRNKELLRSDLWIICDGPVHQSGRKLVFFGVRGDCHLDLTVYASKRPLHSGHYGNWAPNPAMMLVKLLASMKDDQGRVTIKGFYDDVTPLSPTEKKALAAIPPVDEQMKAELGIRETETAGLTLSEAINQPSLNINGMASGNVGKISSNQIPTFATAVLDLRLVLGNDYVRQQQKVIDHIKTKGYHVIDHEPTDAERERYGKIIKVTGLGEDGGYNAQRTSMDLPIAQNVIDAVQSTSKDRIVLLPSMGGSLPLYVLEKYLGAKTISVPIANHDNNQHAENENIRLGNFFEGVRSLKAVMLMK